MINRKFIIQIIGIIVGLMLITLGLMSPLPTIIYSGVGVAIITFCIMVSSLKNIDFTNLKFILPLTLMIIAITLIFYIILTPVSIM